MEKRKALEAYRLLFYSLPLENRWELAKCSHVNEIMDLARRVNCPLSRDECGALHKILAFPEYFNKLPPDAIL